MDVLREVDHWSLKNNDGKNNYYEYFSIEEDFVDRIEEYLCDSVKDIEFYFSDSPHKI
jgi:hypothetical protein